MIIVTGGAGFIGSALVWKLNQEGTDDIMVVDRFGTGPKWKNLAKRGLRQLLHKDDFFPWLGTAGDRANIEAVFHLGASSATTETDCDYLVRNNINYSTRLWQYCSEYEIPFIYASSASTYGAGEHGFDDVPEGVNQLLPMHPYGFSKQKFDQFVMAEQKSGHGPGFWAGLKFFNVYGPQEYHKGAQSSVINQFVPQVQSTGAIKLFKSYKAGYSDGGQARDFVYVKDCVDIMWHLYANRGRAASGIYNVGTGKARSFADLARAVFTAMGVNPPRLEFIEMPAALRDQYQYHTEANLVRLRELAGYTAPMRSLEDGVNDYVKKYLLQGDRYL